MFISAMVFLTVLEMIKIGAETALGLSNNNVWNTKHFSILILEAFEKTTYIKVVFYFFKYSLF